MPQDDNLQNDGKNTNLSPTVRARLQKCYEFGNQKMQAREYDYANEMFTQCYTKSPGNLVYLQSFIANLRMKYGNNKKGAGFAKLKGGAARSQLKIAEARSKFDDVIKSGVELLKLNPWDSSTLFAMGKASIALGYDDAGLALLKHAIESDPNDVETNRFAANELAERNLFDDAIACCQRILNVRSNDHEASSQMKDLLLQKTMQHMERKKTAAEKEAQEHAESHISEEDAYEKKLAKSPDDPELWLDYIQFFNMKGNRRKEEDTIRRALKQFPDDKNLLLRYDDVRRERARIELARIQEQMQKDPTDAMKQKFAEAKKVFDEASLALIERKLAANPNAAAVRFEYGRFLMAQDRFQEAIGELQKAQRDETLSASCFLAIAQCFEKIKQYRLALTHYEKSIEAFGKGIDSEEGKSALYSCALLAASLRDYKKAENLLERLATIDFSYKNVAPLLDKIAKKLNNGDESR